mgnify:CR=1 FL=1
MFGLRILTVYFFGYLIRFIVMRYRALSFIKIFIFSLSVVFNRSIVVGNNPAAAVARTGTYKPYDPTPPEKSRREDRKQRWEFYGYRKIKEGGAPVFVYRLQDRIATRGKNNIPQERAPSELLPYRFAFKASNEADVMLDSHNVSFKNGRPILEESRWFRRVLFNPIENFMKKLRSIIW